MMTEIKENHFSECIENDLRKEILFDGYFYDVTEFVQKHPGGSVIEYYTEKGEDATHAIQQFHKRSKEKVRLMMNSLKRRQPAPNEIALDAETVKKNRGLTEDFTKLYIELESKGYFEPSYLQAFIRLAEVFVWFGIGFYLVCVSQTTAFKLIGVALITLSRARASFFVHELGHYSYSGSPKIDRIVDVTVHGLIIGLSAARWRRQHNRHHAMPQRLHHDVDLDTMPLLAYNAKVAKNSKQGKGFLIKHQASLFVFDTLLVILVWTLYQDPKFIFRRKIYLEMAALAGHCAIFYQIGFWPWLFSTWGAALILFTTFAMNHTFLPVTTEPTHWVEYSLLHTADVVHTPWADWTTGYLNYQIEHHLFPTMPNFRLPFIQDRVKALAEKHNLPYIIHSYPGALSKVFENMSSVSKELSNS
ncbi:acyl-lipid (8-3)-desaturase-like [Bradysia coprophila]|uniref:acyl-lipid (8-3)-desaturase-like n=1 Tax=Bradysia coprophila TaxID=38358 RepID=UPI00187D9863|nr:acyl-lipid (8-3)-desaturase-like [Bradysia coprophila]